MIRTTQCPPSAHCTLPMSIGFLISEPKSASCHRLSEVMGISHDRVNRFLLRESYEPKDLFNGAQFTVNGMGSTLSVDDSFDRKAFVHQHNSHWKIEQYHQVIKPVGYMESFQVRGKLPLLNHVFADLCGYIHLQRLCITEVISHAYRLQPDLFKEVEVIASFINSFILDKDYFNPKFLTVVNA